MKFFLVTLFRIIFCSLFIFISCNILAQYSYEIDSLNGLLKKANADTVKIKLFLEIGTYYEEGNPDSALIFYNKALSLTNKEESKRFKITDYRYIGDVYYYQNNADKAIEAYQKSLKVAEELLKTASNDVEIKSLKKGMSKTCSNIGLAYSDKSEYNKALEFNTKSLNLKQELLKQCKDSNEKKGLMEGISQNYNNYGTVYYYQGSFEKAINSYLISLRICEKSDNKRGMSFCFNNIGSVYSDMNLHEKAIEYKMRSLKIFEELGDKKKMAKCYNNIGNSFSALKKYENAMNCYQKSLEIDKELKDKRSMSMSYINIGELLVIQKKYDAAQQNYLKALTITEELGDKNNRSIVLVDIAELNLKQGKYNNAAEKAMLGLKIAKEIGSLTIQNNAYKDIALACDSLKNYKEAYTYYKLFKQINDSIFNDESSRQIKEMEARYQNEKKQKEIELLNKNEELQNTEIKRQTTLKYAFIFGFVLMFALAFVSYRSYVQKKKDNLVLAEQKRQILEKNEELNQQNEEISAQRDEIEAQRDTVTDQKNEIEKIHHELTDSIRYAKRIQDAVLPAGGKAKSVLGEHFILFKPRDVVSGDFYWFAERSDWLILAVADCTGHGVPGAFMSMLGVSFLNEIVSKPEITTASGVLNEMRRYVISSLQQRGIPGEQKDGMDMSVVAIHRKSYEMQFAGANNPIYIVRKFIKSESEKVKNGKVESEKLNEANFETLKTSELYELKGDKMPIAIHVRMNDFTNNEYQLQKGDSVYLFTDGYADQFGGSKGRKLMYSAFKEKLLKFSSLPMKEQGESLARHIESWKDDHARKYDQTDDITLVGIRI